MTPFLWPLKGGQLYWTISNLKKAVICPYWSCSVLEVRVYPPCSQYLYWNQSLLLSNAYLISVVSYKYCLKEMFGNGLISTGQWTLSPRNSQLIEHWNKVVNPQPKYQLWENTISLYVSLYLLYTVNQKPVYKIVHQSHNSPFSEPGGGRRVGLSSLKNHTQRSMFEI